MVSLNSLLEAVYAARYELLVAVVVANLWYKWLSYRRLAAFKGPFLGQVSNFWYKNALSSKRANLEFYEVSQKYGDLARIGSNILITGDPDVVIRMSSARSKYTRSPWYARQKVDPDHDNMFSTIDEDIHNKKRSRMAIGYSGKEIDGLEAMIDGHILELMSLIRRKYLTIGANLKPMDFARKASFFTMDVLTDIAFGSTWGCLVADEDVSRWFESMEKIIPNTIKSIKLPWLSGLFKIPFFRKLAMPSGKEKTGPGRLIAVSREIVQKRFEEEDPGRHRDMMGSFIRHGVSRIEATSEVQLQILAGVDTTATVIRATTLFIITNPLVYKNLQAEIDSTQTIDSIISEDEARQLPYLQAVINEGARMFPPVTGNMSKVVPLEGDTINDRFIPGGTWIAKCDWAIQRSTKIYGDDATIFRPERWLEAKGETLEKMEKTLGLVWGYGKYSCLGKNIAWIELDKIFFELFKYFDITIADPSHPWKSDNYGLWLQKEMFVKVTERKKGD